MHAPFQVGLLAVRLQAQGGRARIQVIDNGAGIAPELKVQLFNQGFTTREDGHVIDLHSSALAAQLLGGRLALESEGPNPTSAVRQILRPMR